jgi:hypothetical protein
MNTGIKNKTEIKGSLARKIILDMIKRDIENCKIIEFPYDSKNRIRKFQISIQEPKYE